MAKHEYTVAASRQALKGSRKALLCGETVLATMDAKAIPASFARQTPRDTSKDLFTAFRKDARYLHVGVEKALLAEPARRYALAIDGYLNWGLKQAKGRTLLLGGTEADNGVSLQILAFDKGTLQSFDERDLPPLSATFFRDALNAVLMDFRARFQGAKLFQAGPIGDLRLDEATYIGDRPFRGLVFRPLKAEQANTRKLVVPLATVAVGFLTYIGQMFFGWSQYNAAVDAYMLAAKDSEIKKHGGINTEFLQLMQLRRLYLLAPRRQAILSEKAALFVNGIGRVPGVRILEIKLPAPAVNPQFNVGVAVPQANNNQIDAKRAPDVWMSISVPREGMSAVDQAHGVLEIIAANTGLSLRLAHQGWRDDDGRRAFSIEGFIHD